jgi:hypothetical protein
VPVARVQEHVDQTYLAMRAGPSLEGDAASRAAGSVVPEMCEQTACEIDARKSRREASDMREDTGTPPRSRRRVTVSVSDSGGTQAHARDASKRGLAFSRH